MLSVEGVTVNFGGLSGLDSVSLSAASGEIVGVIGPNGAGKTTLFNVICGFVRPASGRIMWKGRQLKRQRPHNLAALGISRTLQGVGLFPALSVLENVRLETQAAANAHCELVRPSTLRTLYGAVLSAALFVVAQNYLRALLGALSAGAADAGLPLLAGLFHPDRWLLWFGLLFALAVYFAPAGLVGALRSNDEAAP